MRVGATIPASFLAQVSEAVHGANVSAKYSLPLFDSGLRGPLKDQIETALRYYKNDGTPYDFNADRCKGPGCAKSENDLDKTEGERLLKCGKCGLLYYCSKKCQKAHWTSHKKDCKTPEQLQLEDRKCWPGGFISLNV